MYGNSEDRLQSDAQTVVNFLSDGAVVDAIMSIERKPDKPEVEEDDDPNIRKIDVTNPPSKFLYYFESNLFGHTTLGSTIALSKLDFSQGF